MATADIAQLTGADGRFSLVAPQSGRYRIGVDFMDACGSTDETAPFRVRAEGGPEPVEKSGNARLERFEPVVLEFDVPGESGGESATSDRSGGETPGEASR